VIAGTITLVAGMGGAVSAVAWVSERKSVLLLRLDPAVA